MLVVRKKKCFDIDKNTAIGSGALSLCRGRFPRSRGGFVCALRNAPPQLLQGSPRGGAGRGGGYWSRLASSCRSSSPTRGARRLGGAGTSPVGEDVMGAFSRKPGRSSPARPAVTARLVAVVVEVLGAPPRPHGRGATRALGALQVETKPSAAAARLPAYPATDEMNSTHTTPGL